VTPDEPGTPGSPGGDVGQGTRRRVRLIANPAASAVSTRMRAAVARALADHDVEEVETEARDHATELAREAAAGGADAVIVLGGDGTVNEAANGLLDSPGTALAALPGGSTNVFTRTLGLPRHADDAAARIATALSAGSARTIPLGNANGRVFLFHVGVGFDAAVVEQVERRSILKRRIGQAIFVYAAFATWFRHFDRSRPRFAVELDDGTVVDDGYFSICLVTNPYTYLGPRPLNVAPGATGEDGLTMVTLRSLKVGALLGVTGRALGRGERVARHPDVDLRRDQQHLVVRGHGPVPWQMDGDYLGEVDEVVLTRDPRRMRVVVPLGEV
jgi:diacylglycerol kinase family enzyme